MVVDGEQVLRVELECLVSQVCFLGDLKVTNLDIIDRLKNERYDRYIERKKERDREEENVREKERWRMREERENE